MIAKCVTFLEIWWMLNFVWYGYKIAWPFECIGNLKCNIEKHPEYKRNAKFERISTWMSIDSKIKCMKNFMHSNSPKLIENLKVIYKVEDKQAKASGRKYKIRYTEHLAENRMRWMKHQE